MLIVESLEEMRAAVELRLMVECHIGKPLLGAVVQHLHLNLVMAHGMPEAAEVVADGTTILRPNLIGTGKEEPEELEVAEPEVVGA